MKKPIIILIGTLCLLQQTLLFAQYLPKAITAYRIGISYDKTSNLIFPFSIKSVDIGSSSVLAQKAQGVENILQLKAGEQHFKETNVTVVTGDGHFYSFIVNFTAEPSVLNFSFVGDSTEKAIIKNQLLAEASYTTIANTIKGKRHSLHKHVWTEKIKLSLNNIFIKNDIVWLQIGITNKSPISFTPAYARFFIQDIKTAKRTATQQSEITPLYKTPLNKADKHYTQPYVFGFAAFTVPKLKELIIQIGESEGSRLLTLRVSHQTMLKIKSL